MNVVIPLECFTLITGVSGSGKSSLIREVLKPSLEQRFNGQTTTKRNYKEVNINTNKYNKKVARGLVSKTKKECPYNLYINIY